MATVLFKKTGKVGGGGGGGAVEPARLFVVLKPLYYTAAALGVVPVAFRGWPHAALSWHPLRSTLLWALLVHALSLASLREIWAHCSAALGGGDVVQAFSNFQALISVVHSAHALLVVPLWCEAHRRGSVVALAGTLADSLDDEMLGASWPPRRTLGFAWFWFIIIAVACPGATVLWNLNLVATPLDAFQLYAHVMANVMAGVIVSTTCLVYYVIEDVALALEQHFIQTNSKNTACAELLRYRRAWLALRDMLQEVMFSPVTVSLSSALLVANSVMCLYHTLLTALAGVPAQVIVGMLAVSFMQLLLIFLSMCEAADGAVHAVAKFSKAFEKADPCNSFAREVFREALSYNPTPVCVAGFWYLTRGTVASVCLMVISYIAMLVEFRQKQQGSPPAAPDGSVNASCSCVPTH